MLLSILFIISFVICLIGVVLFPKCEGRINAIKATVMAIMTIFCYQSLIAFVYDKAGVFVNLQSTTVAMIIADVVLWGYIIWKRRVQRLFFRVSDILCLLVLAAVVIAISVHMFTPSLLIRYPNTDPANHFNFAMEVVKTGKLDGIYFSAFVDAMFIELLAPVIAEISYYKIFILADIFMHVLELWMFYVLVLTISEKKVVRILAPFITLLYFWGYPAYSYVTGGFVYWSNGVMILMLMIYALLLYERYDSMNLQLIILLAISAYANSCCNKLFVPVNYFAFFVALVMIILKRKKHSINKKVLIVAMTAVVIAVGIVVLGFWNYWGGSLEKIFRYVSANGGIYHALYADIIFFLPVLVFTFYYTFFKRRYSGTLSVMALCMVICAVAMYIVWYNYLMSTYYFYKIYYNLWLFGWILAVVALDIATQEKQMTGLLTYGVMLALACVISLTDYDAVMAEYNEEYNGYYATKNLFPLYRCNMDSLLTDYGKYELSPAVLDVYAYAIENTGGEFVPAVIEHGAYRYWFDAMKAQDSDDVDAFVYSLEEIVTQLDEWDIDKIVVLKTEEFYSENVTYFEKLVPLYENGEAALYTLSGESWSEE